MMPPLPLRMSRENHRGVGFGCYSLFTMSAGSLMSYAIGLVLEDYTSDYAIKVCHFNRSYRFIVPPFPPFSSSEPAASFWA